MQNKAIIISGSPRENGNTDFIATIFDEYLRKQQYITKTIFLRKLNYSSCKGCEKCRNDKICTGLKDDLSPIYEELLTSQLWIIGTPVHNYNVSAWIKGFIDRLYCFYNFSISHPRAYSSQLEEKNIYAFIYGIGEQMDEHDFGFTIEAMEQPLQALGVKVINSYKFFGYFSKTLKEDKYRLEQFKKELESDFKKIPENLLFR